MTTITSRRQDVAPPAEVQPALTFLRDLSQGFESRDFAVRFWNGWTWKPDAGQEAKCTLVLKHPGAVRQMFWRPNKAAFGEAYIYDDFDIEGDVLAIFRWIRYLQLHKPAGLNYLRKAAQILGIDVSTIHRKERAEASRGEQ